MCVPSLSAGLFQFTPLREGRRVVIFFLLSFSYFNSRPSARGDARGGVYLPHGGYFNSRPSARGDAGNRREVSQGLFQFTPLREGRHAGAVVLRQRRDISIHAPPRGATRRNGGIKVKSQFQFTPLREGRRGSVSLIGQPNSFQFTPLREGRLSRRPGVRASGKFQFTPLREGRL